MSHMIKRMLFLLTVVVLYGCAVNKEDLSFLPCISSKVAESYSSVKLSSYAVHIQQLRSRCKYTSMISVGDALPFSFKTDKENKDNSSNDNIKKWDQDLRIQQTLEISLRISEVRNNVSVVEVPIFVFVLNDKNKMLLQTKEVYILNTNSKDHVLQLEVGNLVLDEYTIVVGIVLDEQGVQINRQASS